MGSALVGSPQLSPHLSKVLALAAAPLVQDSTKGGAMETGCSGLHYIIGCVII